MDVFWPQIDSIGTIKTLERCSWTKIALTSNHFPSDRQAIMAFPDDYLVELAFIKIECGYYIYRRFLSEIIIFHVESCSREFYFYGRFPATT